jgi:trans-aconitate methyltransferase
VRRVVDLGCGTGSAGAALALEAGSARVEGVDRNAWAVAEANWTYRILGISGRAVVGDLQRKPSKLTGGDAIVASYAVNEIADESRNALLAQLLSARGAGASLLIVEPIARRVNQWWGGWRTAFTAEGGREDEWRFQVALPARQRALAKAAGLNPQELTARSLYVPGVKQP